MKGRSVSNGSVWKKALTRKSVDCGELNNMLGWTSGTICQTEPGLIFPSGNNCTSPPASYFGCTQR
jgi:hypothetical protein